MEPFRFLHVCLFVCLLPCTVRVSQNSTPIFITSFFLLLFSCDAQETCSQKLVSGNSKRFLKSFFYQLTTSSGLSLFFLITKYQNPLNDYPGFRARHFVSNLTPLFSTVPLSVSSGDFLFVLFFTLGQYAR